VNTTSINTGQQVNCGGAPYRMCRIHKGLLWRWLLRSHGTFHPKLDAIPWQYLPYSLYNHCYRF